MHEGKDSKHTHARWIYLSRKRNFAFQVITKFEFGVFGTEENS